MTQKEKNTLQWMPLDKIKASNAEARFLKPSLSPYCTSSKR